MVILMKVNGFEFNELSDLVLTPEVVTFMRLKNTYDYLIHNQEYIKASRIAALDTTVTIPEAMGVNK